MPSADIGQVLEQVTPNAVPFYMQPLQSLPTDPQKPWYKNVPVGVNPLRNMMAKISELAGCL